MAVTHRPLYWAGLLAAVVLATGCASTPPPQTTEVEPPAPALCECVEPEPEPPAPDCPDPVAVAPAPVPEPPPAPPPAPRPPVDSDLLVVGQVEYAILGKNKLQQKARIDTGATTTSIGAHDISMFERDGNTWVRFKVFDRVSGESYDFEEEKTGRALIKRNDAEPDRRVVVEMLLTIGRVSKVTEVTLADREQFDFPVLVGRNFLEGDCVVDVSREYIALDEVSN